MNIVIDGECNAIPQSDVLVRDQGVALLDLLCVLGFDPEQAPLAQLLATNRGLSGAWYVVSPMRWQASHNDAMIVAYGSELQWCDEESQALCAAFSKYLHEEGMSLYYYDRNTWLLSAEHAPPLHAKPIHQVVNCSLMPELAKQDATLFWQKFCTEAQMFFAAHAQTFAVNGVWVWGGGACTEKKAKSVCADAALFDGAQQCALQVTRYSPDVVLKKFDVLLLSDLQVLSPRHLDEITKINACWYWNNTAYSHHEPNWLMRLWRRITHAH